MYDLKLAGAFVELSLDTTKYDTSVGRVFADLRRRSNPRIKLEVDSSGFRSAMSAVKAALDEIKRVPIAVAVSGGGGAGGGGGARSPRSPSGGTGAIEDRYFMKEYSGRVAAQRKSQQDAARSTTQQNAMQDRLLQQEYSGRVAYQKKKEQDAARSAAQLKSIEDRLLQQEYQGRVAHQKKLEQEATRAAAKTKADADRTAKELAAIEDKQLQKEYQGRVAHQKKLEQEALRSAAKKKADADRDAKQLAAIEARWLQREYQDRMAWEQKKDQATKRAASQKKAEADQTAKELAAIEDKWLQREYRERVAYQRKIAQEATRTARMSRQQFVTGVGTGIGLPFATSPQMLAGQAIGRSFRFVAESMVDATKTAIDLETQFTTLQRVSGLAAGEVGHLKQELFTLATSSGNAASLNDIIEIATVGSRMGVANKGGPQALLAFTKAMAQVKTVITDIPAEDLANRMARVLENFALGTEYAKGFGSAIVQMDNASTASASDILNITTRLSNLGQSLGMTLPQVIALSTSLRDAGLTAEVAGTAMGGIFTKMFTKSGKFADAIGMDMAEFEDALRKGPLVALGLVLEKMNSMKDVVGRTQLLGDFGIENQRQINALLSMASRLPEVTARTAEVNRQFQTGQAISEGVALTSNTTAASIERLGSALKGTADIFAGPFLGSLAEANDGLTEFLTFTNNAASSVGNLAPAGSLVDDLIKGTVAGSGAWLRLAGNKPEAPDAAALPALPPQPLPPKPFWLEQAEDTIRIAQNDKGRLADEATQKRAEADWLQRDTDRAMRLLKPGDAEGLKDANRKADLAARADAAAERAAHASEKAAKWLKEVTDDLAKMKAHPDEAAKAAAKGNGIFGGAKGGLALFLSSAQTNTNFFGGQVQAGIGRLAPAIRAAVQAPRDPKVMAGLLADLDKREKGEIAKTIRVWGGGPGQEAELARRAGGRATKRERLMRPGFAMALDDIIDAKAKFANQRAGLLAGAGGRWKGELRSGLSSAQVESDMMNEALNGGKTKEQELKIAKDSEIHLANIAKLLTDIKAAGAKGLWGAAKALLDP